MPRVQAGGEDDGAGDRAAGVGAAGGRDDRDRKPATGGLDLPGAGGGIRQAEPRFWHDTAADWRPRGAVATVDLELHAATEAAGSGPRIPDIQQAELRPGAGDAGAGESGADHESGR